jgi:protein dithiol:quinone oxidoreductase
MQKISPRLVLAAIGFICLGLLAAAWYLQYGPEKQQPCPLCILQRYAYMAMAVVCLVGAAHGPRGTGMLVYAGIADVIASAGLGLAAWQVTKGDSMTSCLADPIGEFVNGLPSANWWPEFLFANGGCADKYSPILGIPVPAWSLIWFIAFVILTSACVLVSLRRTRIT